MVQWCDENYLPDNKVAVAADGHKVVFSLSPKNIEETILLVDQGDLQELTEKFLTEKSQAISDDLKARLLSHHAVEGSQLPTWPPPLSATFMAPTSKIYISMMT